MPPKQGKEEDTSVLIVSAFKSLVQRQLRGCRLAGELPEHQGIVLPAGTARLHTCAAKLTAQSKCKGKIPSGKKEKNNRQLLVSAILLLRTWSDPKRQGKPWPLLPVLRSKMENMASATKQERFGSLKKGRTRALPQKGCRRTGSQGPKGGTGREHPPAEAAFSGHSPPAPSHSLLHGRAQPPR